MSAFEKYLLEDLAEWLKDKIIKRYEQLGVDIKIKDRDIVILKDRFKFGIKVPGGTRVEQIKTYAKDIQASLKLPLFQVVQEGVDIFIIVSTEIIANHSLFRILKSLEYAEAKNKMEVAHPLGFDLTGKPVVKDLVLYPQACVCGTTGSGKSVSLEILLISLLLEYTPDKVNLIICDMAGDLLKFDGFPHLSCPVIHNFDTFLHAILKLGNEMERRISLKGTKEFSKLPRIIFVADEFTSLIAGTESKHKLAREVIMEILRRGRHARIHLILATHNPTQQRLKFDISEQLGFDPNDDDNSIHIENSEYQKQRLMRKRAKVIEDYINTRLGFDIESDYKVKCILKADLNMYADNWIDEEYEETGELHMCHNFLDITYYYELIFRNKKRYETYVQDITAIEDVVNCGISCYIDGFTILSLSRKSQICKESGREFCFSRAAVMVSPSPSNSKYLFIGADEKIDATIYSGYDIAWKRIYSKRLCMQTRQRRTVQTQLYNRTVLQGNTEKHYYSHTFP